MTHIALRVAVAFFAFALSVGSSLAQDRRQNQPGQFDFYVLSLSWSPSFCEVSHERAPNRAPDLQCGARPYSFVVHGLWPQYERGFPEFCLREVPFLDNSLINSMLDLMPARPLVINEWKKHGTCSGLGARGYFETIRKARALVKIPDAFIEPARALTVSPDEIEEAFVKVNPGLTRTGIAVTCDSSRLQEVRICLGKDLKFRDCADVDRRACRRGQLLMPPVRGARGADAGEP